jgi:hypothetical protein
MNVAGCWLLVEQKFLVLTSNEQPATSNFVNLQFFCHKTNLSFWHRFEEEKCQYDNCELSSKFIFYHGVPWSLTEFHGVILGV